MTMPILWIDDNLTFVAAVRQCPGHLPAVQIFGHAHDGPSDLVAKLLLDKLSRARAVATIAALPGTLQETL